MSQAAAVFTVTSAGDQPDCNTSDGICATTSGSCPNGPCTLRAAMMQANASGGPDTIVFSIGSGPVTITPTSFLPILTGAVTIDGTSQPGYAGSPIVEIDGISAGNPEYPAGTPVRLRAVSGHRDTGPTSCPGTALYGQLPGIASSVAARGLPKLYDPEVDGVAFPLQRRAVEHFLGDGSMFPTCARLKLPV